MAVQGFDDFKQRVSNPSASVVNAVSSLPSGNASHQDHAYMSGWSQSSAAATPEKPGTNPTTAVVLDYTDTNNIADSIWHPAEVVERTMIASIAMNMDTSSLTPTSGLLIDRLSHQGGLVANITTLQTTNLPTAPLTRYTDGVGVFCAIHWHAAGSTTNAVISVKYTNERGESGRDGAFYCADTPVLDCLQLMLMADGDTGVRSVESIQLDVSTGSAGNIGITLFKPLCHIPYLASPVLATDLVGWNQSIDPQAHLEIVWANGTSAIVGMVTQISYMDV